MIMGICVAVAVLFGALALHTSYMYGELNGYDKGLDEAERIAREVHDELRGHGNQA